MQAFILPVGDEILIGQITDSNSAWIAQQLNLHGISLRHTMSVGDKHEEIVEAIDFALSQADIILMTGGLGPTKDDITKKAIADFFKVEMTFHDETWARIVRFFEKLGRPVRESHKVQGWMPTNATVLTNKMGTAPGMWFEHEGKILVSMPGVPHEMKYLMEYEVLPRLKAKIQAAPIAHRTLLTAGTGESELALLLETFEETLPTHLKLAYLPSLGQVRLRLTGRHADETTLNQILDEKATEMEQLVQEYVFGHGTETLEEVIGKIAKAKELKIGTAESCTGGGIAQKLTSIAGASAYFEGSIVAYSYDVKRKGLKVKDTTLQTHGAVSEETVKEMVKGALKAIGCDVAIAVSGIMGPSGGSDEKPVGTVCVAVGSKKHIKTYKLNLLSRTRTLNTEYTIVFALNKLRKFLLKM
jgi:nicotinamide-nucleotide amidase